MADPTSVQPRLVHRCELVMTQRPGFRPTCPFPLFKLREHLKGQGLGLDGGTTLYTHTHYPKPGRTIYSHNRARLSLWEVTTEGSPKLHKHVRCSVMGEPTFEEQRGKDRDRGRWCSSLFVFHLNCNEARRAGKSVVLQRTIQEMSKHQLFFPHTPAPRWHSGLEQPTPLLPPPTLL